jgi:hypothetical protein
MADTLERPLRQLADCAAVPDPAPDDNVIEFATKLITALVAPLLRS